MSFSGSCSEFSFYLPLILDKKQKKKKKNLINLEPALQKSCSLTSIFFSSHLSFFFIYFWYYLRQEVSRKLSVEQGRLLARGTKQFLLTWSYQPMEDLLYFYCRFSSTRISWKTPSREFMSEDLLFMLQNLSSQLAFDNYCNGYFHVITAGENLKRRYAYDFARTERDTASLYEY